MTILCEPDQETARSLISSLDGEIQTVADLPAAALTMAADPAQDVVVVGSQVAIGEVLSFSGQVRADRPDVRVILVRDAVDDALLAAAEDAGIRAVVASDDSQQLSDAYYAARHDSDGQQLQALPNQPAPAPQTPASQPEEPHRGRIITVFSTKGGVGRTTIATNLAAALNANGQRRVCLVDLDLAFGDVAITLSLTPVRTIVDAVAPTFQGTPQEHLDALLTTYGPGFDCILAPVEPGDADNVPTDLVSYVLHQLADRYDFVIVDTPAQFSEHVLTALDDSDLHLLVTTTEIPSLKNLRLALDMLDVLGYQASSRGVLLNEGDSKVGVTPLQVTETVRGRVLATLPLTKDIPLSVNTGKPLVLTKPDHPYSQAIRQFADTVLVGEPAAGQRRRLGRRESKARKSV